MATMSHEGLPLELRRNVYLFVLFLYEIFEALPERGILVSDIESNANRVLSRTAQYSVRDNPEGLVREILGEFKSLKALLGIVRDTSVLERGKAISLIDQCKRLEETFDELYMSLKAEADNEISEEKNTVAEAAREILGPAVEAIREMAAQHIIEAPDVRPVSDGKITESELAAAHGSVQQTSIGAGQLGTTSNMYFSERPDDEKPKDQFEEVEKGSERALHEENAVSGNGDNSFSLRQKAILEVLKRREKATVGDLGLLFSGRVSKKTLQRDLQDLVARRVIQRKGDRRWAVYFL